MAGRKTPRKIASTETDDALAKAERLLQEWEPVRRRMEETQRLFELELPVPKKGYERLTMNDPWVTARLAISLLTTHPLRYKRAIAGEVQDDDQAKKDGQTVERAMLAIQQAADDIAIRQGGYPIQYDLATFGCLRGWIVEQAFCTNDEDFPFLIRAIDPANCGAPEYGQKGLRTFVHRYQEALGSVKERGEALGWKLDNVEGEDDETVEVTDLWTSADNSVYVEHEQVKAPAKHGLDRVPVIMLPVGGTSMSATPLRDASRGRYEKRGMDILYGMLEPVKYQNKLVSQIADVFALYSNPIVFMHTKNGRVIPLDLRRGAVNTLDLTAGETVEVIRPKAFPGDIQSWLGFVRTVIQRAGFPDSMYGSLNEAISGIAVSILRNGAMAVMEPVANQMKNCMRLAGELVLEQWEQFGNRLILETNSGGRVLLEEFDPALIAGNHRIGVDLEVALPQDEMAQLQAARLAVGQGVPLVSAETARDHWLTFIQDQFREREQILGEYVIYDTEFLKILNRAIQRAKAERHLQGLVKARKVHPEDARMALRDLRRAGRDEDMARAADRMQIQQALQQGQNGGPPQEPAGPPQQPGLPPSQGAMPAGPVPPEVLAALQQEAMQRGQMGPGQAPMLPPEVMPAAAVAGQPVLSPEEMLALAMMEAAGGAPPGAVPGVQVQPPGPPVVRMPRR